MTVMEKLSHAFLWERKDVKAVKKAAEKLDKAINDAFEGVVKTQSTGAVGQCDKRDKKIT